MRIDPQQARVVASVRTDPSDVIPSLAAGEGSVWSLTRRSLTRIDPGRDRAFGARVRLPAFSSAVAAGAGALWVVDYDSGILRKLDARDGRELAAIPGVGTHAEAVVATSGAVWIASIGPWVVDRHGAFSPTGPESSRASTRAPTGSSPASGSPAALARSRSQMERSG